MKGRGVAWVEVLSLRWDAERDPNQSGTLNGARLGIGRGLEV